MKPKNFICAVLALLFLSTAAVFAHTYDGTWAGDADGYIYLNNQYFYIFADWQMVITDGYIDGRWQDEYGHEGDIYGTVTENGAAVGTWWTDDSGPNGTWNGLFTTETTPYSMEGIWWHNPTLTEGSLWGEKQ